MWLCFTPQMCTQVSDAQVSGDVESRPKAKLQRQAMQLQISALRLPALTVR